ncbi:MAG: hypothetical protein WB870_03690 [Gallionellaceae bacterium]
MNRVRDLPPIRSMPYTLDAVLYNRVRLALLRIRNPLELELEKLGIDLVLEKTCWVGYHCLQISLPLIAWNGFDPARSALDSPVGCTLHLYHHHSWLQLPRVLLALDKELQLQLLSKRARN